MTHWNPIIKINNRPNILMALNYHCSKEHIYSSFLEEILFLIFLNKLLLYILKNFTCFFLFNLLFSYYGSWSWGITDSWATSRLLRRIWSRIRLRWWWRSRWTMFSIFFRSFFSIFIFTNIRIILLFIFWMRMSMFSLVWSHFNK